MRRAIFIAALVALALAPSALAKGLFEVCGATACAELGPEGPPPIRLFGVDASTPTRAGAAPAPYFVIRFHDVGGALAYWIPSASTLRLLYGQSPAWIATLPGEDSLLRDKTTGIRPYPAPTRASAYVNYDWATRGDGYLRLYTIGTPVAAPPAGVTWLPVWLEGGQSPWNDGHDWLWISSTGSLLKRDGQVLRIPAAVARRIRARLPLGG